MGKKEVASFKNLQKELISLKDPKKADISGRYFKTGKGQYAEGDVFLGGIDTPTLVKVIEKYKELPIADVQELLKSKYHEVRSAGRGILCRHFAKAKGKERENLYKFYLKNTKYINNWDLVDTSAPLMVGEYLLENPAEIKILDKLAKSENLWERRIAIMSTFAFLKKGRFDKTLEITEKLLSDKEDLIHKAAGWMLREIGKRDMPVEEKFLKKHYKKMPRTMLRYAIEKFPEDLRKKYLQGTA